jgi:hypothetical protein
MIYLLAAAQLGGLLGWLFLKMMQVEPAWIGVPIGGSLAALMAAVVVFALKRQRQAASADPSALHHGADQAAP